VYVCIIAIPRHLPQCVTTINTQNTSPTLQVAPPQSLPSTSMILLVLTIRNRVVAHLLNPTLVPQYTLFHTYASSKSALTAPIANCKQPPHSLFYILSPEVCCVSLCGL
jgi:hypothetical protein